MLPLALSLLLFVHLSLVGRATFILLGLSLGRTRTWLFAPSLGLAVVGLLVMFLNQAGLPVARFALPLVIGTLIGAGAVLGRGQLNLPRTLLPFTGLALGALILGGWPALIHGFDWIGYGNDDMANYCLGANRFLHHGFYRIPDPADLAGGDYSQYFWMMHVAGLIRFGSEHFIALTAGATRLAGLQVFMPIVLTFALVQLWAVMGLVHSVPGRRNTALLTGLLLAASPLWHFGIQSQLIAQMAGLGLLASALAVTARSRFARGLGPWLRLAGLGAILLGGLCVYYPEVLPFYVLGWGIYVVRKIVARKHWPAGLLPVGGLAALLVLVLLRHNLFGAAFMLFGQARIGVNTTADFAPSAIFPYFLMPAGPAFFLGFDVITSRYAEPVASAGLVGAFLLGGVVFIRWLRALPRASINAAVLVGMLVAGASFMKSGNGFGLFKLAMFSLPFFLIELAGMVAGLRRRWLYGAVTLGLLLLWLPGSYRYVESSLASTAMSRGEVYDASESRGLLPAPGSGPVWSDVISSPVAKLLMLERPAASPVFLSQLYLSQLLGIAKKKPMPDYVWQIIPGAADGQTARRLLETIQQDIYQPESAFGQNFWSRSAAASQTDPSVLLVTSRGELRSFNKLHPDAFPASDGLFTYQALARLKNHLVFTQTTEGYHYYLGVLGRISIHRPQADPYSPEGHFFAVGRHLLFRALNPDTKVRLRFSMTSSLLGEGRTQLPEQAMVQTGTFQPVPLGLIGSGSANVFSPPMELASLHGAHYLALDLGRPPLAFGLPATGLQGIYNRTLSVDTRLGIGYCRDISLVSEADYAARPQLREVRRFPADLVGPAAVEYSGLYEDGWVSDHAFAVLGPVNPGDQITVRAMLPLIPGAALTAMHVELLADGVSLLTQEVAPGHFTLEAPLPQAGRPVKIELRFDRTETLPAPDNRPVTVLLEALTITPTP